MFSALLREEIGALRGPMKLCGNFIPRWSCDTRGRHFSAIYILQVSVSISCCNFPDFFDELQTLSILIGRVNQVIQTPTITPPLNQSLSHWT